MNKQLTDGEVTNRTVKSLLLHNHDVSLTLKIKAIQMFFSSELSPEQILEALRRSTVKEFARELNKVFRMYNFNFLRLTVIQKMLLLL